MGLNSKLEAVTMVKAGSTVGADSTTAGFSKRSVGIRLVEQGGPAVITRASIARTA